MKTRWMVLFVGLVAAAACSDDGSTSPDDGDGGMEAEGGGGTQAEGGGGSDEGQGGCSASGTVYECVCTCGGNTQTVEGCGSCPLVGESCNEGEGGGPAIYEWLCDVVSEQPCGCV